MYNIFTNDRETSVEYVGSYSVLESILNDQSESSSGNSPFFRIFGLRQTGPISYHYFLNFPKEIASRYQFSTELIFNYKCDMYIKFPEIRKREEPRTKKTLFRKKKKNQPT